MAADAFFLIGLVLAMGSNTDLVSEAPVDPELLRASATAQEILSQWHPKRLSKVTVTADARAEVAPEPEPGVAACFTGGVDSYFTLATNESSIDSLLYVYGFDVPLSNHELRTATHDHLVGAAENAGKRLVEVETNVRVVLNAFADWGTVTHGPAIASVGHLLRGSVGRLMIPASHTYADQYPWGSHPLLDPLWGSPTLKIVHDGAGATRVEKTVAIANDDSARRHLHVCWQKKSGEYNCGRCEKCLRTKIALHLSGALENFETFDSDLPIDLIRGLTIRNDSDLSFAMENLQFARKVKDSSLSAALRDAVVAYRRSSGTSPAPARSEPSIEERLTRLERSTTENRRATQRLDNLWPIRTWTRFARWRRS